MTTTDPWRPAASVPGMTDPRGVQARGPAFDHRDPGTPEEDWAGSGLLEQVADLDLTGMRRLVVVAAHPDDETLGAGGLIAEAASRRVPVTVVVATAGEASHPDSPTYRPDQLAAIRRTEVRSAIAALAPLATLHQLDLPDGGLAGEVERLADAISPLVGEPGTWLVAPWRADRHPDHAAASAAAARVAGQTGCRLLEYPVWAWHWARPGDGTFRPELLRAVLLSDDARRAKGIALAAHQSQVAPLSDQPGDEPVVPAGFRDHFRRTREVFLDVGSESLDQGYFDDFYSGGTDRWGFRRHWYEKRKRAITLACLPRERFATAFEPGCAIGVLTAELAQRCDEVLSTDISEAPLVQARERLAGFPQVRFERRQVPGQWPDGRFDLIVLSEIGYYCGHADLGRLIELASSALTPDGVLLACHWRHPVHDYPLSGDEVHARLRAESGLVVQVELLEEDFRIDVLVRPPAVSVARREGLVR